MLVQSFTCVLFCLLYMATWTTDFMVFPTRPVSQIQFTWNICNWTGIALQKWYLQYLFESCIMFLVGDLNHRPISFPVWRLGIWDLDLPCHMQQYQSQLIWDYHNWKIVCIATMVVWTSIWVLYYLFCVETWTTDLQVFFLYRDLNLGCVCCAPCLIMIVWNSTQFDSFESCVICFSSEAWTTDLSSSYFTKLCLENLSSIGKLSKSPWFIIINLTMTWSLVLVRQVLQVRKRSSRSWRVDL